MEETKKLFEKGKIGRYKVDHRIVMSPMTRARAEKSGIPTDSMVTYYSQRTSAALIITEAIHISPEAYAWLGAPGLFNEAQVQRWKTVTEAVHEKGGRIFAQLWHGGIASHRSLRPDNKIPAGPSAVKPIGDIHIEIGKVPYETSRALELSEIQEIVKQYKTAAQNALNAGFDGVELHAAGYLPQQFLHDSSNLRTDEYGGSVENRSRFVLEILKLLTAIWGGDRVGIKLAPGISFIGLPDSNPMNLYSYMIKKINSFDLAYVHMLERIVMPGMEVKPDIDYARLKSIFNGSYIANGNYNLERAEESLADGLADFVSFGALFIANPDLVNRFRLEASLNAPDVSTFYSDGDKGYIDYPTLSEASQ